MCEELKERIKEIFVHKLKHDYVGNMPLLTVYMNEIECISYNFEGVTLTSESLWDMRFQTDSYTGKGTFLYTCVTEHQMGW